VERSRLEADIADSTERINQARSAIGLHRVMVAMLLESQRELTDMREQAEQRAKEIIAEAEREAAAIAAGTAPAPGPPTSPPSGFAGAAAPAAPEIHLPGRAGDDGDHYFRYLSGALADDAPLGPAPE